MKYGLTGGGESQITYVAIQINSFAIISIIVLIYLIKTIEQQNQHVFLPFNHVQWDSFPILEWLYNGNT